MKRNELDPPYDLARMQEEHDELFERLKVLAPQLAARVQALREIVEQEIGRGTRRPI